MERAPSSTQSGSARQLQRLPLPRGLVTVVILGVILMVCSSCSAFSGLFVLWAQYSGAFYLRLAPAGWTNVSLSGSPEGMQYAISQNDPGIILACGSLAQGYQDTTACWHTTDGGSHWQTLREGPFQNALVFQLAAPRDAGPTFFAVEDNETGSAAVDAIWVTHDAGQNWRHVTTMSLDYFGVKTEVDELSNAIYRNGRLYGLRQSNDPLNVIPRTFSVSANDGATWTPVERKPSALEQQGWSGYSFAADYRSPNSWFRTMEREGPGEYLEHSADDGRSWQTVSEITSTAPVAFAKLARDSLASTPARPGALCASGFDFGLVASDDGGHTWRTGVPTAAMTNLDDAQLGPIAIGADGTCYASYLLQFTSISFFGVWPPVSSFEIAILQLAPDTNQISQAPLPSGYLNAPLDNTDDLFAYVPAGHGMSARLVLQANTSESSWFSAFSGADPTSINILIWRSVP